MDMDINEIKPKDTLELLDNLLKDRNMTLYGLCKISGISYSTFDTARKRNGQLTMDTIWKICLCLRIPVYQFFMSDEDWDEILNYMKRKIS